MGRAKTGFLPDTGSVMAQVVLPLWSVVIWVFIDVNPFVFIVETVVSAQLLA
jgi:hypothetical protein